MECVGGRAVPPHLPPRPSVVPAGDWLGPLPGRI